MANAFLQTSHVFIFKRFVTAALLAALSALPLVLLAWIFETGEPGSFQETFTYVLSGRIFDEEWHPIHAGSTLDQPTIGKAMIWFTIGAAVCLSYMEVVRRFLVYSETFHHWIFALGLTALCLFLICFLTMPFWWMIQYIDAMGWTAKRLCVLLYGTCAYIFVVFFWYKAALLKKRTGQ
jgi:hypothetical protein